MTDLCLVTGGGGFIGSYLVEALTGTGCRVRVFDNFSTGRRENLDHVNPPPEIITGDLTEAEAVAAATAGVKIVYHLGAIASVQKSIELPLDSHRVCATGTLHVLDAARRQGVRRLVYAASSSAYGKTTSDGGISEDARLDPLSPYAAAKLAGEYYARAFSSSYGLETVALRFFNVFGPRQRADSPYSGVIAIFIAAMAAGKTPIIHGDGLQSRDFIYVSDAVQALWTAAQTPNVSGRVFNIGTGRSTTVLDLVATLNRILGTKLAATHGPLRQGDVRHSRADVSRAHRELRYEPKISLEEGLRRTVEWYGSGK